MYVHVHVGLHKPIFISDDTASSNANGSGSGSPSQRINFENMLNTAHNTNIILPSNVRNACWNPMCKNITNYIY